MMRLALAAAWLVGIFAVPWDAELQKELNRAWHNTSGFPCFAKECHKPAKRFERILDAQPGIQWMDHGGYCGAWSIQRAAMVKGAWISQQQVRNHTVPGGGHDNEILDTNIAEALRNLKLKAEGFDYKHLPTPQADPYRAWIKRQLVAGNAVVWMIMLKGGHFPVYPGLRYGFYSHVEPVVGILSDHDLSDDKWYDDDYVVHYTDANTHTYYRSMQSLPDDTAMQGNCASPDYAGFPCFYEKYGIGWAVQDLMDERASLPLSLNVEPFNREPDVRLGEKPEPLQGTVNVRGLTSGGKYIIYRWDSVSTAFDYAKAHFKHAFTASGETYDYVDQNAIASNGTTYYRCVEDTDDAVLVV